MMQTAMMPFPYPFTCPLFLDVSSSSHATSPAESPSPPGGSYHAVNSSSTYDVQASSASTTPQQNYHHGHSSNSLYAASLGLKHGGPVFDHGKPTLVTNYSGRKSVTGSSFTIKAILGLSESDHHDHHAPGHLRSKEFKRHADRLMNPFPAGMPVLQDTMATSATTRTPISPDSTAKDITKYSKSKASLSHGCSESLTSRDTSRVAGGQAHHHHHAHHPGSGGGNAKAKRVRTIFTPEQLERLESEFERQQYMVGPERLYLASALNLTEAQVKVWFQNRRIKWRKQNMAFQRAKLAKLRQEDDSAEVTMDVCQSRDDQDDMLEEELS